MSYVKLVDKQIETEHCFHPRVYSEHFPAPTTHYKWIPLLYFTSSAAAIKADDCDQKIIQNLEESLEKDTSTMQALLRFAFLVSN